jgi:hypothetical protein
MITLAETPTEERVIVAFARWLKSRDEGPFEEITSLKRLSEAALGLAERTREEGLTR